MSKRMVYWVLPSVYGDELEGATLDVEVLRVASNEDQEHTQQDACPNEAGE